MGKVQMADCGSEGDSRGSRELLKIEAMEYNWIRNKACLVDGVEHTISHRMKRDKWDKAHFTTVIIKNHPTNPEKIISFDSESSDEMYEQTEIRLKELAKNKYEIGDYID